MKIPLFYFKWKICFPHVWKIIEDNSKEIIYQCSICKKIKRKRK